MCDYLTRLQEQVKLKRSFNLFPNCTFGNLAVITCSTLGYLESVKDHFASFFGFMEMSTEQEQNITIAFQRESKLKGS